MHFSLGGGEQFKHSTANQEKRDKGNKCTFVFLVQKKEIQMSLLSAKEQCVCAVTHNKSSKTNSSTEARYKALSDRGLTL